MSNAEWEKFDNEIDVAEFGNDVPEGDDQYIEVPPGTYEVAITKLETGIAKSSGNPKLVCFMKVLDGDYKGGMIFMHQTLNTDIGRKTANRFLISLMSKMRKPVSTEIKKISDFPDMVADVYEAIDGKFEYLLKYSLKNTYPIYKIEDVYELE